MLRCGATKVGTSTVMPMVARGTKRAASSVKSIRWGIFSRFRSRIATTVAQTKMASARRPER